MMIAIAVSIVRWVSDDQPGIVECKLSDRFGKDWVFIEKSPVVSADCLLSDSPYPAAGVIACRTILTGQDDYGREFPAVDTDEPWGVEAVDGTTRFEVHTDQLLRSPGRDR